MVAQLRAPDARISILAVPQGTEVGGWREDGSGVDGDFEESVGAGGRGDGSVVEGDWVGEEGGELGDAVGGEGCG